VTRNRLTGLAAVTALACGMLAGTAAAQISVPPIVGGPPGTLSPCYGSADVTFPGVEIVPGVSPVYRVHHSIGLICAYPSPIWATCYSAAYDVLDQRIGSATSEGANACNADESTGATYPVGTYVHQQYGFTMTLTAPGATWGGSGNGFCTNGPPNVGTCSAEQTAVAPLKQSTQFG
jgi:hypothetical protein